jgi:putative ABC transport system ATP-binding protein
VTAPTTTVVLEVVGVEKSFVDPSGTRVVLRGVDLTVARGEIVAVIGRSGSGKTTLLTVVAGLEDPDVGTVRLPEAGVAPADAGWSELAILPQSLGLLDELTVEENIALPLRLHDVARPAEPADLLSQLGLEHLARRFPSEISLGEQQRTALARAAVVRPRLLLADEPISHQNQAWAKTMMLLLEDLADSGTSCLLATHNALAFGSAERILELRGGVLEPADV